MSDFDDQALTDAFGSRPPAALSRRERVRLLGEAAQALMRGELPDVEARLFLAGGLSSWLAQGGDLLREYWQVKSSRGSHLTAPAVWQSLHRDEGDDSADLFKSTVSTETVGNEDGKSQR